MPRRQRLHHVLLLAGATFASAACSRSAPRTVSAPQIGFEPAPLVAAPPPAADPRQLVDSIFRYDQSPGCAVSVVQSDSLVFEKGYGLADLEHGTPVTPQTVFYLASVSKQFTAMSLLLLAADHKLSLDDPVRKWVPEVPPSARAVTLRHLLFHTSGLRDYFTLLAIQGWPTDGTLSERQFLDLVSRQRALNFPPGERSLYSNTGYALLGIVVQRASGMSLREFAAKRIFEPLGMTSTQFRDDHQALIANRALGYERAGASFRISVPQFDVVGDGGMFSTVEDLAKWDANFESGIVGGRDATTLLQTTGTLASGAPVEFAMGMSVGIYAGARAVYMSGAYGGYRSSYYRFPDHRLSVIVLCNTSAAPPGAPELVAAMFLATSHAEEASPSQNNALLASLSGAPMTERSLPLAPPRVNAGSPPLPADVPAPDEQASLEGRYYSDELNMAATLRSRDGVLIMQRQAADDIKFTRRSADTYASLDGVTLRVTRDRSRLVTGFTLTTSRVRDLQFTKVPFSPGRSGGPGTARR